MQPRRCDCKPRFGQAISFGTDFHCRSGFCICCFGVPSSSRFTRCGVRWALHKISSFWNLIPEIGSVILGKRHTEIGLQNPER
jgi:hypothetical protein